MSFRTRVVFWYLMAWVILSLYFATADAMLGGKASFWSLVGLNLGQNCMWVISGFLLMGLADLRPVDSARQWPRILMHLGVAAVLGLVSVTVACGVFYRFYSHYFESGAPFAFWPFWRTYTAHWYHVNLLIITSSTWVYHWFRTHERLRQRTLEAAQLESRFAESQHRVLRWQLQPHFLFNTLNSISAMLRSDPDGADRMLSRLGEFFRMTLETDLQQWVSLKGELNLLKVYLAIEQVRFGERLRVVTEVPRNLESMKVPSLILQPLVENSLKHGIGDLAAGGTLTLRARREADDLVLEVEDDGVGMPSRNREGIGLQNIRARLELCYGKQAVLELQPGPSKGTLARIRLPLEAVGGAKP